MNGPTNDDDRTAATDTPAGADGTAVRTLGTMTSTAMAQAGGASGADDAGDAPESFHSHPLTDRRRSPRQKRKFVTQMTPWTPGVASVPFDVIVEDVSHTGVGLLHAQPLKVGLRHVLNVPRGEDEKPASREYVVVRCDRRPDGTYAIGMEQSFARASIDEDPADAAADAARRVTSRRTKTLFLVFGLFGLLVALLAPL